MSWRRLTARPVSDVIVGAIHVALLIVITLGVCAAIVAFAYSWFDADANEARNLRNAALAWLILIWPIFAVLANRSAQYLRDSEATEIVNRAVKGQAFSTTYCLFLRPFAMRSQVRMPYAGPTSVFGIQGNKRDFEGALVTTIRSLMKQPVICIGQSGEEIGAGRGEVSEERWRQAVQALADQATLIVTVVSGRTGTAWEIRHLLGADNLRVKTLFAGLARQRKGAEYFDSKADYEAARPTFEEWGVALPPWNEGGLLFKANDPLATDLDFFTGRRWIPQIAQALEDLNLKQRTTVAA